MAGVIPRSYSNLLLTQRHTLPCLTSITSQHCNYSEDSQYPRIIKNPSSTSLKRGTGGRSSFNGIVCTVFGNTGFFGRYVCNRLGKIGTQLILPYRGEHYDSMKLKLSGDLGQILFHPFDLRDEDSIMKCIKYSNVVVNLVGRDWETKNFKFEDVHVKGAQTLARLSKQAGVERFIHVSALGANPNPTPMMLKGGSQYFKTKHEGELAVKEVFPNATIVRPGTVYGQEDRFFNTYGRMLRRHFRGAPLWKKGEMTEKQPIWVGDVAAGIAAIVKDPGTAGQTYQFVGPKRYKLSDLVDWINHYVRVNATDHGYRRYDLESSPLFKLKVSFIEAMSPGFPFGEMHWEGLEKEHTSDVLVKGIPTLEDLGIQPCDMESRIAWELKPKNVYAYYAAELNEFPKPVPPTPIKVAPF